MQNQFSSFRLFGQLTAAFVAVVLVLPAGIASARNVVVDPIKETLALTAGEETTAELTISNGTDEAKAFEISFAEFTVDDNGVPSIVETPSEARPADWVTIDPAEFSLDAGGEQVVSLVIDVPAEAAEKGYYLAATTLIGPVEEQSASNTTRQEIQSLYSLVVGAPAELLEIESIALTEDQALIRLFNPADVHTTASGKLEIYMDDVLAESYNISPVNIFPGVSRDVPVLIDPELPNFSAKATLAYGAANRIVSGSAAYDMNGSDSMDDSAATRTVQNTATVVNTGEEPDWLLYGAGGVGIALLGAGGWLLLRRRP